MKQETLKFRKKAINSHHKNSKMFYDRYEIFSKNPYANAFVYGRKKMFEFLLPYIKKTIRPGASALDVGCGTGYFTNLLGKLSFDVIGAEPASGMRERAQAKFPRIKFVNAKVTKLPFRDNSFNLVSAIELFRYLEKDDIKNGYKECLRVLRPGGYLVVSLVNLLALDGFLIKYWIRLLLEKYAKKDAVNYCDFVTPWGVRKYFRKEFGLESVTYAALFSPLRIAYLVNNRFGEMLARKIEPFDEKLCQKIIFKPFAGHLILIVKKK